MSARFTLVRTADPSTEPITLEDMKRHLRCYEDMTSEDAMIESLITAAREWAEDFTGRAFGAQTWRLDIGDRVAIDPVAQPYAYCGRQESLGTEIYLRRTPVTAITAFVSVDSAGAITAVDAENYELRDGSSKWPRAVALNGASWATGEYRITFTAGGAAPEMAVRAMLLYAESLYVADVREVEPLMAAAERLLKPLRVDMGFA